MTRSSRSSASSSKRGRSSRAGFGTSVGALDVVSKNVYTSSIVDLTLEPVSCCAPLSADPLSDDEAAATAMLFKALGDPARVRIVNVLATTGEPVCVCNLTEPLGLTQPTVSHHLKRLLEAGFVEREQRGRWAYFSLKPAAVETLAAVADLKGAR